MYSNNVQQSDLSAGGEMLPADSQSGGGSIGAETADVLEEHAACSRNDHGQEAPGTSPDSPPKTVRELEIALRALGYSKRQAKEIASHGFKGLADADPEEDMSEQLVSLLKQNLQRFSVKDMT